MKRSILLLLALGALCVGWQPVHSQEFDIYVSDGATPNSASDWKILKYGARGQAPETFIDDNLSWPQDILFLEAEQVVLVSNLFSGRITRYSAEDGVYIDNFAVGLNGPTRIKIGPDGKIYVLQWNLGRVLRFERDGTPLGPFTESRIFRAIGVDWDSSGNMYVSSYADDLVQRFDSEGNDLGVFASEGLNGPTDVWFDDQGNLLVLNFDGNSVSRFSPSGGSSGLLIPSIGRPEGIVQLPSGNVLIGEGVNGSVREYSQSGGFQGTRIAAGSGGLVRPNAIVLRAQADDPPELVPNAGLNDAWFNPETSGQGFFINVFPEMGTIFLGWFTFGVESPGDSPETAILGSSNHRWLTAIGGWEGNKATLDVTNTIGGKFDDDQPVENSESGSYGVISIDFHDCSTATLNYDLFSIGLAGTIPIERITNDNVPLCEALRPGPSEATPVD